MLTNMIPEIEFKRSKIYETTLLNLSCKPPIAKLERPVMLKAFAELESKKDYLYKLLEEITNILGIKWKRKSIRIYCLSFRQHGTTFSDPLTISLCTRKGKPTNIEDTIDLITHEFIHNALDEINEKTKNALIELEKDFPKLSKKIIVHILVHSVHYLIYEKTRGFERLEADKEKMKDREEYATAWKITEEKGAKNILEKYLSEK